MAWKRNESDPEENPVYSPPRPAGESHTPSSSAGARRERAVIGASISIQGDLSGEEDLTILGRVQGKVDVKGNSVTIGETGKVKADVYGKMIVVEGEVEGNLYGGDQIVLRTSGSVHGNLTAPRVALEDGAQFKGSIDMEPKRQSAPSSSASSRPSPPPASPSSSSPGSGSNESSKGGAEANKSGSGGSSAGSAAGQAGQAGG